MKLFRIILKNVRRNILRTALTALGTMVLVFVVTLVWSVLDFLNEATRDKTSNFKAVITERWQIPAKCRSPTLTACRAAGRGKRETCRFRPPIR